MQRHFLNLVCVLFLGVMVGCTDSAQPLPGSESMPGVDDKKVRLAVRDYLFWNYSARYIEQMRLSYSRPEEADGKATDLVVHVSYAFATRDASKIQTLKRGQERLRLQETNYGYRVLELNPPRLL